MAQKAYPDSDISKGSWSPYPASPTTLWDKIDEVTQNGDTDYAVSTIDEDECEVGLTNVTDPAVGTGHKIRCYAKSPGGGGQPEKLIMSLVENGTVRAATSATAVNRTAYTLIELTLTTTQADSITNYANLRLRFHIDAIGGGEEIRVTQAEFECPDAVSGVQVPINLITVKAVPHSVSVVAGALIAISLLSINAVPNAVTVSAGANVSVSQSVIDNTPYPVTVGISISPSVNRLIVKTIPHSVTVTTGAKASINQSIIKTVLYPVTVEVGGGVSASVNLQTIKVVPYPVTIQTGAKADINQQIVKTVPYSVAIKTGASVGVNRLIIKTVPNSLTISGGASIPVSPSTVNIVPFSVTVSVGGGGGVSVPINQLSINITPYKVIAIQSRRRVSEDGRNQVIVGSNNSVTMHSYKNKVEVTYG